MRPESFGAGDLFMEGVCVVAAPENVNALTRNSMANWGGNRLAYAGGGPVSDRFQTSVRPVSCRMHSPCHSVSSPMHSPCHHVMSDLHSGVMSDAQCHFECTVLTEIHESNLKVVRCW